MTITGYTLHEKIFESSGTLIFRGEQEKQSSSHYREDLKRGISP